MRGDTPVLGDYDGDNKNDIAVYRTTTSPGNFYVLRSSDNAFVSQSWGDDATDIVTPSYYDGDGKTDFAVYRIFGPDEGTWYIRQSSNGSLRAQQWGIGTDTPAPIYQTANQATQRGMEKHTF